MKEILALMLGLLTKAYNKTEDEIKGIILDKDEKLNDNALELLLNMDAARVTSLKALSTKKWDDAVKKTTKEVSEKYETIIKELTGVESDKVGDDLVSEAKEHLEKSTKKSTMKDDDVKKHPLFIQREKELKKEKEDAISAKEKELNEFKSGIETDKLKTTIRGKLKSYFTEMNPILSSDPVKAENQMNLFIDKVLAENKFQADGDDFILLKEDGTRKETPNGHPIKLKDFSVEQIKANYDLKEQEDVGGSGNKNKNNNNHQVKKIDGVNMNPKSEQEFVTSLSSLESMGTEEALKNVSVLHENYKALQTQK